MLLRLFSKATITIWISIRFSAFSIYLTGFSIIFIYLWFHLASFAPFKTLDFYLVNSETSEVRTGESLLSNIQTVISTCGYLSSAYSPSRILERSRQQKTSPNIPSPGMVSFILRRSSSTVLVHMFMKSLRTPIELPLSLMKDVGSSISEKPFRTPG